MGKNAIPLRRLPTSASFLWSKSQQHRKILKAIWVFYSFRSCLRLSFIPLGTLTRAILTQRPCCCLCCEFFLAGAIHAKTRVTNHQPFCAQVRHLRRCRLLFCCVSCRSGSLIVEMRQKKKLNPISTSLLCLPFLRFGFVSHFMMSSLLFFLMIHATL